MIFFFCQCHNFIWKHQSDVTREDFLPLCQHTTAPRSFATSAWSHPLQHKHNIQENGPVARIISPCNTNQLLSSASPPPSLYVPCLKHLSNGPTRWPDTHAGRWQIRLGRCTAQVSVHLHSMGPDGNSPRTLIQLSWSRRLLWASWKSHNNCTVWYTFYVFGLINAPGVH